jgi:hypothetical protein
MSQEGLKVGTPEAGGASRLGAQGDGGPAFPCDVDLHQGRQGMSLRDQFAGRAMQGELAAQSYQTGWYSESKDYASLAELAYRVADAMILARGAQNGRE